MSGTASRWTDGSMDARLRRRYAAERRFRLLGLFSIGLSVAFLAFLLVTMAWRGLGGFSHTEARLTVDFPRSDIIIDPAALAGPDAKQVVASADLEGALVQAATAEYGEEAEELFGAAAARALGKALIADPSLLSRRAELWLPVASAYDIARKDTGAPEAESMVASLDARGDLKRSFNAGFLTNSDATDPGEVGVWGALKGSFLTIVVTMALAFPIGVLAALYLEEFAPRNRWTDLIEVSINNLAAVLSIIFGLLGLAVFLNFMHLPRSGAIVGVSLQVSEETLGHLLALYAGFFLYMGATDLLPEAHQHPSRFRVALTAAGFVAIFLVAYVARV